MRVSHSSNTSGTMLPRATIQCPPWYWLTPPADHRAAGHIPDAVFRLAQRQLAPRKVAIEKCPAPGLSPRGDHMAIAHIKTGVESRGIPVICGDQMAFNGMPAAEQPQHLTH